MKHNGFSKMLDSSFEFEELINCIKGREALPANIIGVSESVISHLVFCAHQKLSKPVLIIVPDGITARNILEDLQLFFDEDAMQFPERELIFYDIEASAQEILSMRLNILERLNNVNLPVVIATVPALLSATTPKSAFDEYKISFKVGEACDINSLAKSFVHLGYVREDMVEGKGQFSIRGGIVDFFSHSSENPCRIELFYDEVDSIREFDVLSQRSLDKIEGVTALPAGEFILDSDERNGLIDKLKLFLETEDHVVPVNVKRDIERLENSAHFPSIDKYIPLIYPEITTIMDYISKDSLVFVCEPARVSESAQSSGWQLGETVAGFIEKGIIPPIDSEWRYDYIDAVGRLSKGNLIGLSGLSHSSPDYKPKRILSITSKTQSIFHGKIEFFYDSVRHYKNNNYGVVILGGSPQKAKNIAQTLCDEEIIAGYVDNVTEPPKNGQIIVTHGELNRGFEYPLINMAVISDKEIFGKDRKRKRKIMKKSHERLSSFTDLNVGDFVVHQNHGIGQFSGIKTMTVDGATADYLQIRFNGNDSLYVPTNQLDLLFKYVGKDGVNIKLNKLGGTQWQLTKQKVKKSCADMADQLIRLYASRQNIEGVAFSPNKEWHKDFDATFPYDETDDQLLAIDEVRSDMEKPRPMDRLLCGDVGYGKTEIALRAAFKAVMDGYQVAYLVPTTILANQHYKTFCQRMKDFPIKVEMLSRFRTAKQQRETVKRAKTGEVDIIIGTHRIIQKDIEFKKLGLLIIDEEQRFGVAHKERLKEIRNYVDVLTLTATPIPRTLHMSMIGIRDMSVLENPPKDRYPVSTYVLEYNAEMLKDGIVREVARGGQGYYLHNRVHTIDRVAAQIRTFAPDLRVAVGHGKMTENQLEDIMQQVLDGDVDVLVCTTIIETGLDIPNINTIIVEDADKMGLSQLYQLRGRVGRSNRLAYAYLVYKRDKALSETAEKRLRAIRDFTEFGSGFKIALRDLEIRGAGNVVGAQQHGHMDAVGYDMYCKLLGEAVAQLKGEPMPPEIQTAVSLNINAFIPKDYITHENYRIEIYKKIAAIECQQDAYEVYEEIEDRYGNVPPSVANLIEIALIRSMAALNGIDEVMQKENGVIFSFSNEKQLDFATISKLIEEFKGKVLFSPSTKSYITLRQKGGGLLNNIKSLLQGYKRLKDEEE